MKKLRIADIELSFEKEPADLLCNICLQPKSLTVDHVPPQGIVGNNAVIVDSVLSRLATGNHFHHNLISRNGLKFKTICSDCNSRMSEGDNILKKFASEVRVIIESPIQRPRPIIVRTAPNIIMRSVLGHLLAAKAITDQLSFEESARSCVKDFAEPIAEDLHLLYWVYPFRTVRIIRDFIMTWIPAGPSSASTFQLLKFYPLAFLVIDSAQFNFESAQSLDQFRQWGVRDEADLVLPLPICPPEDWPEASDNNRIVMTGSTGIKSIFAKKRVK